MAARRKYFLNKSCVLIIVVASVERFAYKGVASNLVTYLTDVVHQSNGEAAKNVSTWAGLTSMLPLLGAFLTDSYFNRYSTIILSSFFYLSGLVALASLARFPHGKAISSAPIFGSLYLISFGLGGYNPSLQAFGADQLDEEEDGYASSKSLFFKWSYFGICSGSLLGVSILPYIQDTLGWELGFALPAIAMGVCVVCFICGTPLYRHKQCEDGGRTFGSLISALRSVTRKFIGGRTNVASGNARAIELELPERPIESDIGFVTTPDKKMDIATIAWEVFRLLPIWATFLMFAVILQQPSTFFTKQGSTMKRNIGEKFQIPPAALQSTINLCIIMLMPIYDSILIPILKIITQDDKGIDTLQRIGIGMFFSITSMIIAALTESKRLHSVHPINICWLLPQYVLLGVSDVFMVVGIQEFFYSQVSGGMKTMGIALYLSVFGVGGYLSAILISLVEMLTTMNGASSSWFSDNLSKARLDCYYGLLAVLSIMSMILFVNIAGHYKDDKIDSPNTTMK
ncbi:hypothetical protein AMTRI_Chr10g4950 [Amborella trichopoda]